MNVRVPLYLPARLRRRPKPPVPPVPVEPLAAPPTPVEPTAAPPIAATPGPRHVAAPRNPTPAPLDGLSATATRYGGETGPWDGEGQILARLAAAGGDLAAHQQVHLKGTR